VLVVDDGSTDATLAVAESFVAQHPNVSILKNPHRGKGYAIKSGMLAARGDYRFMCDADLSMPIEELARFLPPNCERYDIAIGSREGGGAHRYNEPFHRHLMGRVFNAVVQLLTVRGITDTQCGFKCFRAEAVEALFPLQRTDGWSFDVEILFLAQRRRLRVVEVPIAWHYKKESRVNPLRDTSKMFVETMSIRWNYWMGKYKVTAGEPRSREQRG